MNDEALDYKLHRLEKRKSTCLQPGNWAYLDSNGGLHKLTNDGYYAPWKSVMWTSSYWSGGRWAMGEIAYTKGGLIAIIEKRGIAPTWLEGFGKLKEDEIDEMLL